MKVTRKQRLGKRQSQAIATKLANRRSKEKERARRDERMIESVKAGAPPFTPDVMSWLSIKLGIKAARVTDADLASLRA